MYLDWFSFSFYSSNPSDFNFLDLKILSICDHQSNKNVASKFVKSLVEFNGKILSIFGLSQVLSEEEIVLNIWELNESWLTIEEIFLNGVNNVVLFDGQ